MGCNGHRRHYSANAHFFFCPPGAAPEGLAQISASPCPSRNVLPTLWEQTILDQPIHPLLFLLNFQALTKLFSQIPGVIFWAPTLFLFHASVSPQTDPVLCKGGKFISVFPLGPNTISERWLTVGECLLVIECGHPCGVLPVFP